MIISIQWQKRAIPYSLLLSRLGNNSKFLFEIEKTEILEKCSIYQQSSILKILRWKIIKIN